MYSALGKFGFLLFRVFAPAVYNCPLVGIFINYYFSVVFIDSDKFRISEENIVYSIVAAGLLPKEEDITTKFLNFYRGSIVNNTIWEAYKVIIDIA